MRQLGIGEYGPIYDAEVKVKKNLVSRALVKVGEIKMDGFNNTQM